MYSLPATSKLLDGGPHWWQGVQWLHESTAEECHAPYMRTGESTRLFQARLDGNRVLVAPSGLFEERSGAQIRSVYHAARLSTTFSSKVNLPRSNNFGALCGANLVT